ncbi:hypothetical protein AB0K15_46400 [Amycolatopsis sp. NPDC049253]|uniref:hypothetical protein n=1 Tax=Amycolatopsis sp. NPDC049253 TaxID=3155274 RepID=UPI0034262DF8
MSLGGSPGHGRSCSTSPFYGTKKTFTGDIDADGGTDLVAVNDTDIWVLRSQ